MEVRAERIDRIFLEGQKLITMVVSWEGNWGANVKSIVPLNVFSGFFKFHLFILFLPVLGLHCYAMVFSNCGDWVLDPN